MPWLKGMTRMTMPFLPGIVCIPMWLYLMTEKGAWVEAFSNYYPMALAMIIGCFIAGSTPLGGAVVAFPVAVLIIKFNPVQGRDFAVLIQSVGMTAAAYLIAVKKRHLVDTYFVQTSCVANTFGVILGFCISMPGFWVNVSYMTYTVVFAGVFLYKNMFACDKNSAAARCNTELDKDRYSSLTIACTVGLFCAGLVGGVLASKLGSGSDTMAFVFGIFVYNPLFKKHGYAISESALTASSVVIMAYTTVVVAVIRLVQGDIDREVFHCWGAVLWIVVFGAPIGSLVLNKSRETIFRRLFYVLAVIQFATFAILKINSNMLAWCVIGAVFLLAAAGVAAHALLTRRSSQAPSEAPVVAPERPEEGEVEAPMPILLGCTRESELVHSSLCDLEVGNAVSTPTIDPALSSV